VAKNTAPLREIFLNPIATAIRRDENRDSEIQKNDQNNCLVIGICILFVTWILIFGNSRRALTIQDLDE
jgi:hypothetical protein